MDPTRVVRSSEINFLRIQIHTLQVILKNKTANVSCHNFGHGSDFKFVVQIFTINTSHFFGIENAQRFCGGLGRILTQIIWVTKVRLVLHRVVAGWLLQATAVCWLRNIPQSIV